MTTDQALRRLLARYRQAAIVAEAEGDDEVQMTAERRRDILAGLVSYRARQRHKNQEAARRQREPRRVRDHY